MTVTPGWTGVISFLVTDVPGNICNFLWAHRRYPAPLPIFNRTFNEAGGLSGSFPTDRGAQGTIIVSGGFPTCTAVVNWTATTDGTPPWVTPPAPPPAPPAPPPSPQPRPPAQVRCVVPNVKGKTVPAARKQLTARRCALGKISRKYSPKVKKDRIIGQSRPPGARLPRATRVNVVVSRGRRR